ncbi:MAG: insulinase family protein, partial [Muribaculaceae bacterium]|nr:insulinase family protein [Muribaculaceae bacterium]
ACDLTLADAEIDAERAVIHEEWRQSMKGNMRIMEALAPKIYPGNKYGERLPIGTMEVVDNFPYQALKDYYHKWYRPDQQGIIVVGDIDPDYIESKIKEIFTPINMPTNPAERIYVQVEDTPGTIYAVGSDPEMPVAVFQLMIKSDSLPAELKNTQAFYMTQYLMSMVTSMLNERFGDLALKPDCPFAQAYVRYGDFFLAKTKDALTVQGVAKGGDITGAYEAIYRELLRAVRGGFTQSEYDRAKAEFISRIEKAYNERNKTNSAAYVQEYVDNFLDGNPIPGVETDYQIYEALSQMIPLAMINQQLLPELLPADNRILMVMMPEGEGYVNPTEQELQAITTKIDAENIEAYVDNAKTEPLIPQLPAPGKIVKEQKLAQWDATELTLSNGVKVIVKPTGFKENEIVMNAIAIGGTSEVSDDLAATMQFFPYGSGAAGAFDYTNADLDKYLSGKQAGVSLSFGDYSRSVDGSATVKDLPVLMELVYAYFTGYKIYPDEFASLQNMVVASMANQVNTPEYAFQRSLMKSLYASPKRQAISTEAVKQASREETEKIAKSMLANAADYTFVFVGNIDMDTFR